MCGGCVVGVWWCVVVSGILTYPELTFYWHTYIVMPLVSLLANNGNSATHEVSCAAQGHFAI